MTLADMIALHEIGQLKYRYLRGLDTQDWKLVEDCFIEQASVWYGGGQFSCTGRDKILALLRDLMRSSVFSSHIVMHPEIKLTGPSTAAGIWRLQDIVHFTDANPAFGPANIRPGDEMSGAGYYYDEYVKADDGWKVARMGYVRIFEAIDRREFRPGLHLETQPARGVATG